MKILYGLLLTFVMSVSAIKYEYEKFILIIDNVLQTVEFRIITEKLTPEDIKSIAAIESSLSWHFYIGTLQIDTELLFDAKIEIFNVLSRYLGLEFKEDLEESESVNIEYEITDIAKFMKEEFDFMIDYTTNPDNYSRNSILREKLKLHEKLIENSPKRSER